MLLAVGVLALSIGVNLPVQEYFQKNKRTSKVLIKDCNVVDVKKGLILENRYVAAENGRIIYIDSIPPPLSNYTVIDARGKYLIPGLWDMHIHTLSLSPYLHFPLLLANGVTGIRDMGDGDSWVSDINKLLIKDQNVWYKAVEEKGLLAPRIPESCSYHVEEIEASDNIDKEIHMLISALKDRGEPFVKLQLDDSELNPEIFYQILDECNKQGIRALGHLSPTIDIDSVLDKGYFSIEHAWALIPHFSSDKTILENDLQYKKYLLENQDSTIAKNVLQKMAGHNTYYVPTHVSSNRKEALVFDRSFKNNAYNYYIENAQLSLWKLWAWLHTNGYDEIEDKPILQAYYERGLAVTKLAHENGVVILAGTDALDRYVYHGFSLHDELQEMVKAGLSEVEALQTATINAAIYHNNEHDFGSIEKGKVADFILLNENPLENIQNTKKIESVYFNECLYLHSDLEAMKEYVHQQAKSFRITCRFIWNMIKA
jgi:hypothetical protein